MKALIATVDEAATQKWFMQKALHPEQYKIVKKPEDIFGFKDTIMLVDDLSKPPLLNEMVWYAEDHQIDVFYLGAN